MKQLVLIVDDEFGLAEVSADFLVDDGFDVAIVINGQLALDFLETRGVSLVIADLMMPVLDGVSMIRQMRADPRFAAIPVVLMTALPEAVPEAARPMIDVLLVKPFTLRELLETVHRLLRHRA
jgi:DNA-binding response OmpR family regulator